MLTGEGADEWLVGYPWYKAAKLMGYLDVVPGLPLSDIGAARLSAAEQSAAFPDEWRQRVEELRRRAECLDRFLRAAGHFEAALLRRADARSARTEPSVGRVRISRWNAPNAGIRCNRGVWIAARVLLAGHLLQAKGDRVAMHSSVEVRYPFLDEDVFDFIAKLHPRWKLRGFRDKHLLRLLAERWVPKSDRAAAQGHLPRAARQLSHGSGAAVRRRNS